MTQSLEKIVFVLNEGLHRDGIFPDDKYVTQESLLLSIAMSIMLIPFAIRAMDYILSKSTNNRYFEYSIPVVIGFFLYMMEGYLAILLALLIAGFVGIVYKYPQYGAIRRFFDRIF